MDDGPHVLGVFGAGPTSLFPWHIRRVRDCGLCIERLGSTEGWIPTVSLWWQHTPNQSLSDPKALCHDNSLAVMTTVAIECVLLVVDWGLERQKACCLPRGMDTAHKWSAEELWMMVPMCWVCLEQGQHHYSRGILEG